MLRAAQEVHGISVTQSGEEKWLPRYTSVAAPCTNRVRLDLPRSLVTVEDGKLDVHEDEVGSLGLRLRHAFAAVSGFGDFVARSRQKVTEDAA